MRRISVLVAVSVVFGTVGSGSVLGAEPAMAQTASSSGLCDTAGVGQFTDLSDADYGAAYVLCMRALGLSHGVGDGSYGPDRDLNRAQMASFLVRLWRDVLGNQCPTGVVSPFVDVEAGSVHAANIDCLYGLGITSGTTATTYGPWDPLKASQITRFLYRTHQKSANGSTCNVGTGETELEWATACLLQLHVIPTQAEATDAAAVTRAQMGVYVIGLWHNLAGRGRPPTPPQLNQPTQPATTTEPVSQPVDGCEYWQEHVQITGSYDSVIEQEIAVIKTDLCDLEADVRGLVSDWVEVRVAGCEYYGDQLTVDLVNLSLQYSETISPIGDRLDGIRGSVSDSDHWYIRTAFSGVVKMHSEDFRNDFREWDRECYVGRSFCPAWQYYVRITGDYDAAIEQEIGSIRTDLCTLQAEIRAWAENEWNPVHAAGCELYRERHEDIGTSLGTYLQSGQLVVARLHGLRDVMNDNTDWRSLFRAVVEFGLEISKIDKEFVVWDRKCYAETTVPQN